LISGMEASSQKSPEQELRERATERLKSKREFRTHLVMYMLVNAMLVVIWAVTDSGFFWPIFPIVGWGIGLGGHAWSIYGDKPIAEDEIRREMDQLR
jgi:uncharacterized ion transporter superfamily protein YfcC